MAVLHKLRCLTCDTNWQENFQRKPPCMETVHWTMLILYLLTCPLTHFT